MRQKKNLVFCLILVLPVMVWSNTLSNLWTNILNMEEQGEFQKTTELIQNYLEEHRSKLSAEEKERLEFEIDRIYRIRLDYRLNRKSLFESLKKDIPDLTESEFNQMEVRGYVDTRMIDGERKYMNSSRSNLFIRYPEYRSRRVQKITESDPEEFHLWKAYEKTKSDADNTGQIFVNPQKYRMTMTITVDADAVPDGKLIRCWMPFPRKVDLQKDIRYISSKPEKHILAPEDASMRSIYLEQRAVKGNPTVFVTEYEYTCYSRYQSIDPETIKSYNKNSKEYIKWTEEKLPHIFFSHEIKEISKQIVGNEKNPYLIAHKIYDWIGDNTKYSYAHEYSTIPNISAFCLNKRYGDCGQHALLFITLCRYNGIPARWQSGWSLKPDAENLHDWSEIYIEPYGWIPVDPDFSVWSHFWKETIGPEKAKILRDFYFGSIDHFRLVANGDHGRDFIPSKKSFRSDTVDFQRAELECEGKNIYFDKFRYKMKVERL